MIVRRWAALIAAVLLAAAPALAFPQPRRAFPAQPVTIVVPYPPGGSNDFFARQLARALTEAWKLPVSVDNRAGAGGEAGAAAVARAAPDGYTLGLVSASFATRAAFRRDLPYDALRDFTPVAMVAQAPLVLAVPNTLPVRTTLELFDLARRRPGELICGSAGRGSANQVAMALLMRQAQVHFAPQAYPGIATAVGELTAGNLDVLFASAPSIYEAVRRGRVRALGVTTRQPSPLLPELRPLAELGLPGFSMEAWWGLAGPRGMPPAVVRRINADVGRIVSSAPMRAAFAREGAQPLVGTPEQFAARLRAEIAAWREAPNAAPREAASKAR